MKVLTGKTQVGNPVLSLTITTEVRMRYAKFDRYRIYEDGRVYSEISGKFMKPDIDQGGYEQVTLTTEQAGTIRTKVHRLVASMFVPHSLCFDEERDTINHIDGNKRNNSFTNLEWCTDYENNKHARDTGLNNIARSNSERWENPEFRTRTSATFSRIRRERGLSKGRKNGRFRYSVKNEAGHELSREEVSKLIGRCMSATDVYIRRAATEHIPLFESHGLSVCDTKKSQSTIERDGDTLTE